MKRRSFITLLVGAMTWAFAARAEQPVSPVVGFLGSESPEVSADRLHAFRLGLSENDYTEGNTISVEYRWAYSQFDRLPALAADLAARRVSVMVAPGNTTGILAAKAATSSIPIVFLTGGDPVQLGLVASLNRPGGNLTGITTLAVELGQKQLELVHELIPNATSVALLINPANFALAESTFKNFQAAALTLGMQLHVLYASSEPEIEKAFADLFNCERARLLSASMHSSLVGASNSPHWQLTMVFLLSRNFATLPQRAA